MLSTKMIAATMLGIATAGAIGFSGIVAAQQGTPVSSQPGSLNATIDATNGTPADESGTTPAVVVNINNASNIEDPFAGSSTPTAKNESLPDPFGTPSERYASTTSKLAQPTYSHVPKDASATEKRIYAALDQQTPALDFPGETGLEEVLSSIMEVINQRSQRDQRIKLVIDHKGLDNEGLSSLEDILVKDVDLSGIKLQTALKLILDQTDLEYLIRDDVLFLTTKFAAVDNADYYTTRVYPVKKLLAMQTNSAGAMMYGDDGAMGMESYADGYPGSGGGGLGGSSMGMGPMDAAPRNRNKKPSQKGGLHSLPTQLGSPGMGGDMGSGDSGLGGGGYVPEPTEPLIELVCNMTSPPCLWQDRDGEGGAISLAGTSLVVRQSRRGHEEIVKLLNLLANAEE